MDINDANKIIEKKISGYKLQRENEIYAALGIDPLIKSYQLFSFNFPIIQKEILLLLGLGILSTYGLSYIVSKNIHPLTSEIARLRLIKEGLQYERLQKEITEEDLERKPEKVKEKNRNL